MLIKVRIGYTDYAIPYATPEGLNVLMSMVQCKEVGDVFIPEDTQKDIRIEILKDDVWGPHAELACPKSVLKNLQKYVKEAEDERSKRWEAERKLDAMKNKEVERVKIVEAVKEHCGKDISDEPF